MGWWVDLEMIRRILSLIVIGSFSLGQMNQYHLVETWPIESKEKKLGQVTAVAISSKDEVIVFHRSDRGWVDPMPKENIKLATIFIYNSSTGLLIDSWGEDEFIMPHGLSVDAEDNIWVTDVGAHQVKKFSPKGKLLITLGESMVSGDDSYHFGRPTDIAFDSYGNVYISDGYWNSRIVKFSKNGIYLSEWGEKGAKPGQFDLPHGIAIDEDDFIYVADRSNSRIQIFDKNGLYIKEISGSRIGRPYGLIAVKSDLFIIDGGDQPFGTKSRVVIFDLINQSFLKAFKASLSSDIKNLGHDIAVGKEQSIYVADVWLKSIRKYIYK